MDVRKMKDGESQAFCQGRHVSLKKWLYLVFGTEVGKLVKKCLRDRQAHVPSSSK